MPSVTLENRLRQHQAIAPRQLEEVRLLAKSLPELRSAIADEADRNPAIEEFDHPLEVPMSAEEHERTGDEVEPDYLEDDFTPGRNLDEDALERRQRMFENQTYEETLQQHLTAQLPSSDIPKTDYDLVEILVGDLNDNGYYTGSLPDMMMGFDRSEDELVGILHKVMEFDPPGCGARNLQECLTSQLDAIDDVALRALVKRMIATELENIGTGRDDEVLRNLGIDRAQYEAALKALRSLEPHPGRKFPSEHDRIEYVNPEVHAVKNDDGKWVAITDKRSIPDIRISQHYLKLLNDPNQTAETKACVKTYIERAQALQAAVIKRQRTIQDIADFIFERQQAFFEGGYAALKPMTETEIAEKLKVDDSTVSRTVCNKYVDTPKGTIELRKFFTSGMKRDDGEVFSQAAAMAKLRELIDDEDKTAPLSDSQLVNLMKSGGFPLARRTIAKYRDLLHIPTAQARREDM